MTFIHLFLFLSLPFDNPLFFPSTQHLNLLFTLFHLPSIPGNTVSLQYSSGVHKISSWSHITNAHLLPGPSIITGLSKIGIPKGRGLLLLAEMSSSGNLCTGDYTKKCVENAIQSHKQDGFTIGFIAQRRVELDLPKSSLQLQPDNQEVVDLLVLSPGVGLDSKGDSNGQNYRNPDQVIRESGSDVIIVGRGIYGPLLNLNGKDIDQSEREEAFGKVRKESERYRKAGWLAYQEKMKENGVHLEKIEIEG